MQAFGFIIIIKRNGRDGTRYPVTTKTCTVGRGINSDVRIHVQSVSEEHCKIFASGFGPVILRNLSSTSTTEVNGAPIDQTESHLQHGDIVTTGDRSFRWEYLPDSPYYVSSIAKSSYFTSPLRGSTGMVGMPISMLQSALGNRPFHRRSVDGTESRKTSVLMTSSGNASALSKSVSFSPSERLVAIVSPQRRSLSKKVNEAAVNGSPDRSSGRKLTSDFEQNNLTSSDASLSIQHTRKSKSPLTARTSAKASLSPEKSVVQLNHTPAKQSESSTPMKGSSSKSPKQTRSSDIGVKVFYSRQSLQTSLSPKTPVPRTRRSASTSLSSSVSLSGTGTKKRPSSLRRMSVPNRKSSKTASSSKKGQSKSSSKTPNLSVRNQKRKLESGLRSAERAAKRLKLETPKTPDKKKMAALMICHGKASLSKSPEKRSEVLGSTSKIQRRIGTPFTPIKSPGSAVRKTARKKSILETEDVDTSPKKNTFSVEIPANFNFGSKTPGSALSDRSSKVKRSSSSPVNRKISNSYIDTISSNFNSSFELDNAESTAKSVGRKSSRKSQSRSNNDFSKKTPKLKSRQSLFEDLMRKSLQSKSLLHGEGADNETPTSLRTSVRKLSTRHSVSFIETPAKKSRSSSTVKQSPASIFETSSTRMLSLSSSFASSSNTPLFNQSSKSRHSRSDSLSPKTISSRFSNETRRKSVTNLQSTEKVKTQLSSSTPVSIRSSRKSRSSSVLGQSAKRKSQSLFSDISLSPSESFSKFSSRKSKDSESSDTSLILSSRSGYPSTTSVTMTSPPKSVLLRHSLSSVKKSGTKKRVSWSHTNQTCLTSPSSLNTTFDFESVKTPHIPLESLVSPLSANKKRSRQWQSMSEQRPRFVHSLKGKRLSERIEKEKTSRKSNAKPLTPQQLFKTSGSRESLTNSSFPSEANISSNRRRSSLRSDVSSVHSKTKASVSPTQKRKNRSSVLSPRVSKSSASDSSSEEKSFIKTSRNLKSPRNDLRDVRGVKQLMKTPKSPKSPENDLRDVRGVRNLLKTPRSVKSPRNDLQDFRGVKNLLRTPRSVKSPKNDLRDVRGVRNLLKTPRSVKSPRNDLRDVRGVKKLMKTPRSVKSPRNDLRDVRGVKKLMKTPRSVKSPKNDLRDVRGVKKLMKTPRSVKSPKNDLRDVRGVKRLLKTPRTLKSPKNDLTDIRGVKQLMKTPKTQKSPKNDLTDVGGVKQLMKTPRNQKSPKNDLSHFDGVKELLQTPVSSTIKNKMQSPTIQKLTPKQETKINTRTRRNNKRPDSSLLKESHIKQSPRKGLRDSKADISSTSFDTSTSSKGKSRVYFDLSGTVSSSTPVTQNTRRKRAADPLPETKTVEVTRRNAKSASKGKQTKGDVQSKPVVSSPKTTRTRRGTVISGIDLPSVPTKQRRGVNTKGASPSKRKLDTSDSSNVEIESKKRRGTTVTAIVDLPSPIPSPRKTRRGATVTTDSKPSPQRKTRGRTKQSPTLKRQREESTSELPSPPKKRRGAKVIEDIESQQSPAGKKQRGKIASKASPKKKDEPVSTPDKPLKLQSAKSPISRRGKRAAKEIEPLPNSPVTKRRGRTSPDKSLTKKDDSMSAQSKVKNTKSPVTRRGKRAVATVVSPKVSSSPVAVKRRRQLASSADETASSSPKPKTKKAKVISSPVAKSPVSTRSGRKQTKKIELSPVVQPKTRASRRRK